MNIKHVAGAMKGCQIHAHGEALLILASNHLELAAPAMRLASEGALAAGSSASLASRCKAAHVLRCAVLCSSQGPWNSIALRGLAGPHKGLCRVLCTSVWAPAGLLLSVLSAACLYAVRQEKIRVPQPGTLPACE